MDRQDRKLFRKYFPQMLSILESYFPTNMDIFSRKKIHVTF